MEKQKTQLQVISELVQNGGFNFKDYPEYKDDRVILTIAMADFPYAFYDASDRLKDDEEIVDLIFDRPNGACLGHMLDKASERMKYNPKYVLKYFDKVLEMYGVDKFGDNYRFIEPLRRIIEEELEIAYVARGFKDENSKNAFQKIKKFNENKNE